LEFERGWSMNETIAPARRGGLEQKWKVLISVMLVIGLFLPGWPAKWGGRGSTQPLASGGH
jgi:hypothetical protein